MMDCNMLSRSACPLLARALHWLLPALVVLLAACVFAPPAAWAADDDNQVDTRLLPDSSFIYETSIYDLQTSDVYYEGQTVQITGEVVGDLVKDESDAGHCWITVDALPDQQAASIQVYVSADQASLIDTFGRYQVAGSTVSVMGTYHLVCDQHMGLSDMHAVSLTVTEPGHSDHVGFSLEPFVPALALAFVGLGAFAYYRRRREELR